MHWSQEPDGSYHAGNNERLYVIHRRHIPYPPGAPPGLKLLCGRFWEVDTFVNGRRRHGPGRLFDSLDDAQRACGE